MSSAVVSTSAALGRPFVFDDEIASGVPPDSEFLAEGRPPKPVRRSGDAAFADPRLAGITSASRLDIRPAPQMASSGVAAIDALAGGLPRGCLTEICGPASSGRTTLLFATLAAATRRGEFCAVVDASDALDPQSASDAGVALDRLLWVRCGENPAKIDDERNHDSLAEKFSPFPQTKSRRRSESRLEQVLRATDLLLESGGFGLIVLDLGDVPAQETRRVPLTTWFRFRRAVEHTPTMLLAIEQQPIAGSCSSLLFQLKAANRFRERAALQSPIRPSHAELLTGIEITAELICSRLDRKPSRSASAAFTSKTAWAG
jgi:hypothetical protein